MSTSLLELKGTAEEIQKRLDDFAGQRRSNVITEEATPAESPHDGAPRKTNAAREPFCPAMYLTQYKPSHKSVFGAKSKTGPC